MYHLHGNFVPAHGIGVWEGHLFTLLHKVVIIKWQHLLPKLLWSPPRPRQPPSKPTKEILGSQLVEYHLPKLLSESSSRNRKALPTPHREKGCTKHNKKNDGRKLRWQHCSSSKTGTGIYSRVCKLAQRGKCTNNSVTNSSDLVGKL